MVAPDVVVDLVGMWASDSGFAGGAVSCDGVLTEVEPVVECALRSATNTLVVNRPLINILILRFTSLEITQEVSALSLTKINRLGGFLWKKVKKIHFGHLVTPMRDLTFIQQLSNSHISDLLSFLCGLVMFLNTVANQAVEICRNLAGKRRKKKKNASEFPNWTPSRARAGR